MTLVEHLRELAASVAAHPRTSRLKLHRYLCDAAERIDNLERELAETRDAAVANTADLRDVREAAPVRAVDGDPCPECGAPVGWSVSAGIGSSGRIRCTSCTWTGRALVRRQDGEVVALKPGAYTWSGYLAKRAAELAATVARLERERAEMREGEKP